VFRVGAIADGEPPRKCPVSNHDTPVETLPMRVNRSAYTTKLPRPRHGRMLPMPAAFVPTAGRGDGAHRFFMIGQPIQYSYVETQTTARGLRSNSYSPHANLVRRCNKYLVARAMGPP
jgi:hypothetical protein